jgi:hypothetical protein
MQADEILNLLREYNPVLIGQKSFRTSTTNHIDGAILEKDLLKARENLLNYKVMRLPGPSKDPKALRQSTTTTRPRTATIRSSTTIVEGGSSVDSSESTIASGKKPRKVSSALSSLRKMTSKSTEASSPVKQMLETYTTEDWAHSKVILWFIFVRFTCFRTSSLRL